MYIGIIAEFWERKYSRYKHYFAASPGSGDIGGSCVRVAASGYWDGKPVREEACSGKLMEKFYGGICIQGAAAGCWVNPGIKCWLTQVSWAGLLVGWKRWDCVFELTYQQVDTIFRFTSDDTMLKTVFEIFNDFMFRNADATNENKPRNVGASLKCFHSQKTCSVII